MKKNFLILFFLSVLLYPVFLGYFVKNGYELIGQGRKYNKLPIINIKDLFSGIYQENFNDYFQESFWGRDFLVRIRNTVMYFCHTSPAKTVALGVNGALYEPAYIKYYCQINGEGRMTDEQIENAIQKLRKFSLICHENDKEFYLFFTPDKTIFFKKSFPWQYEKLNNRVDSLDCYFGMKKALSNTDIHVFDSIQLLADNPKRFFAPKFYATGCHWDNVWAQWATENFVEFINQTSQYNLQTFSISEEKCEKKHVESPNADLYLLLNLLPKSPRIENYRAVFTHKGGGYDKPKVFMRGSSFMSQSLKTLKGYGIVSDDSIYFENSTYERTAGDIKYLKTNFSYDDLDKNILACDLSSSDIIIFEIMHAQVNQYTFGFLDYLLEHQELLGKKNSI